MSAESDETESLAVSGDGVVTLPVNCETEPMSIDLPANVAAQLQMETVGNIQANNRDGRNASTQSMAILQAAAARNFDELGAVESRATSGVMATPIASPTTA